MNQMRTSIVFLVFSALVACSLAAPVLDRRVRQASSATDLLNSMRSGLRALSKHSKFRLAQSLNVSCSSLRNGSTLRSALNATCRLYDANRILPNISLPDQTAQEVLEIMSEKSVQDACTWINDTLSFGLPSDIDCSNVSTLSGICSQWNELSSIERIESKVDRLPNITINETMWFESHNLTRTDFYSNC